MREGWELKKLGDVCSYEKTKYIGNHLPYVGLEHIQSNTGKFLGTLDATTVKSSTFHFTNEHLLYGRLRPYLNKVLIPNFEGHCSTEIFPIKVEKNMLREYLFYWLTSSDIVEKINATWTGARMPRANMKEVIKFEIPIPSLKEQKQIVTTLDKAFKQIDQAKANLEKNLNNAKELFQSKLNEVFSQRGEGWEEKVLKDIAKFIDYRGRTPKKTESGIRLITAKNVKMGVLNKKPEEFIAEDDYDNWMTRGIPQKGDVLFTTEAPLAMVALLDTDEKIALAQRIITLCPNREILSGEYLHYCLQSKRLQDDILSKGTGATVTGIKSKLLKEILIIIPKQNIQKNIVNQLDLLKKESEQLQTHYQQKLNNLEELKKSILQKAFKGELAYK